jgi:putative membrane protein
MTPELDINVDGKRLSVKSIFYRFSRQIPMLGLYIYFGVIQGSGENYVFLIMALLFGFLAIPSTLLSFIYFKYLITQDELIIQSGIVNRKQRNIPLKRIQNVNIQQNFVQRLLGISTVKMETAGDSSSEAVLDSVGTLNANEIKEILMESRLK